MALRVVPMVALAIIASTCARRVVPPPDPWPAEAEQASRLVHAGCYACLKEAHDIYQRGLIRPASAEAARRGVFITAVFLAVREKELGLAATPWLDAARARATRPDEQNYIELAASLSWEGAGRSVDFDPPLRMNDETSKRINVFLRRPEGDTLDRYLLLAQECRFSRPAPENVSWLAQIDAEPAIVRYRLGLCGISQRAHLERVLREDERYVEASFFLGRYTLADLALTRVVRARVTRAIPHLNAAHNGLPHAPIITVTLADAYRAGNELHRALELYDEGLALRPTQRDALLGRTIVVTYLGRPDDAIATATRMLELGAWYQGEAHYWRSWNRYRKGELDAAATDIADAKRFIANGDVLTLSGMIAYDQRRATDARKDFEQALRMEDRNCAAAWYLGHLDVGDQTWPAAAGMFTAAAGCYRAAADEARRALNAIPEDLSEAARQQQTSEYEGRLADTMRQEARSAFNAAQAWLRLGDRAKALDQAQVAALHPDMKEKADALLKTLERR